MFTERLSNLYMQSLDISINKVLDLFKLLTGVVFIYAVYKTGKIYLIRRKYKHIPGPPTKGILGFFFGNVIDVYHLKNTGKVFPDFLVECREKYGDVFKFQLFDLVIVNTTDKEAVRDILITKNYPKPTNMIKSIAFPLNQRFLGNGLVTDIDYKRWKHRRALFNPGFHRSVLITFIDQFNIKADMLMERLRSMSDGKTMVNLLNELNHTTLDAIAQIAFGMNIDSINKKDSELSEAVAGVMKILEKTFREPFFKYKLSARKEIKDVKTFIQFIRDTGKDKILERLKALKNQEHVPTDILSSILHSWKDEDLDLESLIDDFVTFFIAGQETTANTLASSFLEIGKNKDIFLKAREEIDSVLGERNQISYQDAVNLKYCNCIFKEALRLYPPATGLMREISEDITIDKYKLPKGTVVSLSTYVSGRHESYFPNPLEFKPERFLKDPDTLDNSVENYTFFPFSLGPRNCIGQNFAQIEGVILIAKFVQKFDFELDPYQSFGITQELTLKPKDGTRCTLTLRS